MASFGFYLIFLALLASVFGALFALLALRLKDSRFYRGSFSALAFTAFATVSAFGLLAYLCVTKNYAVVYVAANVNDRLPSFYAITASWAGLEGSHLLWTAFVSLVATIAMITGTRDDRLIKPYIFLIFHIINTALILPLIFSDLDPFVLKGRIPSDGNGMNGLLQNSLMSTHPPLLLLGYAGLSLPFAYSIAALVFKDVTLGWLNAIRRWTLFSWCTLSAGIGLGSVWAYYELGWGGYWVWDPVENAALMVWLLCTGLLHTFSSNGLETLRPAKITLVLAIVTFIFCFLSMVLTRSNITESLHSFSSSNIGKIYFCYLVASVFFSILIYFTRTKNFTPYVSKREIITQEQFYRALAIFLFLVFLVIVLVGTFAPVIFGVFFNRKITIQAPYFNTFAPYLFLALLTTLTLAFKVPKLKFNARTIVFIGSVVLTTLGLVVLFDAMEAISTKALFFGFVGYFACALSIVVLSLRYYQKIKSLEFKFIGGFVVHGGFVLCVIGFMGNYRIKEAAFKLTKNEQIKIWNYTIAMDSDVIKKKAENYLSYISPLSIKSSQNAPNILAPGKRSYRKRDKETLHDEVAVLSGLKQDIYLALRDWDRKTLQSASYFIKIQPGVGVVWMGMALMIIGGAICLLGNDKIVWRL